MTQSNSSLGEWSAVATHADELAGAHLRDLTAADPQRWQNFHVEHDSWLLDISRQRITGKTLRFSWKDGPTKGETHEHVFHEDGSRPRRRLRPPAERDTWRLLDVLEWNFVPQCSVMFRRGVVAEWPAWFYGIPLPDWSLHLLHAERGPIGYIPEVTAAYRLHPGGIHSGQSEIAKTIADQLQAKISPSEKAAIEKAPTTDLAAFDLYERAKALWADVTDPLHAKEKLPQAAQLLDEAVARDPQFLLAWCLLSRVHGALYWTGHDRTQPRLELANVAVQTALRLQPEAGEAHRALATYYYYGFRDYARARSELAVARRTLPNDAEIFLYTGLIDRREGHWDDSTRNLERALELDVLFFSLIARDSRADISQQLFVVPGFLDEILRAGMHRIDYVIHGAEGGNHNDR